MNGKGETKLVFPGLAGFYESIQPYGYPIIRFAAGAVFMYHGYAKLFLGFGAFVAKNILTPMGFPIPGQLYSPVAWVATRVASWCQNSRGKAI